ncbi:MAG TPA: hypothetical protein VFR67_09350 [Pilimelia sp.]|nr:hypothetical protein [Pilimelia sp.]
MTVADTVRLARARADTMRSHRAGLAIATLGTRVSFVVVPWLALVGTGSLGWAALAVTGQTLGYLAGCPLAAVIADRTPPARLVLAADLAGMAVLAGLSFTYADPVPLLLLAALLGLVRAGADRARDALAQRAAEGPRGPQRAAEGPRGPQPPRDATGEDAPAAAPPRRGLVTAVTLLGGAAIGAVAALLGPLGGLWLTMLSYGAGAALTVLAAPRSPATPRVLGDAGADRPRPPVVNGVEWSESPPPEPDRATLRRALAGLRRTPLILGLAVALCIANVLAQAGAMALVAAWDRESLADAAAGFTGGAFVVGAVGTAAVLTAYAYQPARCAALAAGYLLGGGVVVLRGGPEPGPLLLAAAAMVAGVALASVTPTTPMIVADRAPAALRSRIGGATAVVAYAGIPAATAAGGWIGLRAGSLWAGAVAALLVAAAALMPVVVHRAWRQIAPDTPPPGGRGAQRLAGRISVTLVYTDGQWLVEVRRGRALLGSRHPVQSAAALRMLASLDVPAVSRGVEQALAGDHGEATRQAQRMRTRLAEVESKLADITEMVELTEDRGKETR